MPTQGLLPEVLDSLVVSFRQVFRSISRNASAFFRAADAGADSIALSSSRRYCRSTTDPRKDSERTVSSGLFTPLITDWSCVVDAPAIRGRWR